MRDAGCAVLQVAVPRRRMLITDEVLDQLPSEADQKD